MMRYQTAFDEEGRPTFSYYRERLIRREAPHLWKGRVHEAIECSGSRVFSEIAVTHRSQKIGYSDRNLRIYEAQAAAKEPFSPRDMFYYGRELYYHERYGQAILVLQHFLTEKNGWIENKIEACKILSYCHLAAGNTDAALDALFVSFRYDLPRAEICCEIGNIWMKRQCYRIAAFWYERALTAPYDEAGGAFLDLNCHGYLPSIQLCVCYDRMGDIKKAEAYNHLAGKYRPHAPEYLQNLKYFAMLRPDTLDSFE